MKASIDHNPQPSFIMASHDILRKIVANGCDLTLNNPIGDYPLLEIVGIAKSTGAKVSLPTTLPDSMIEDISLIGKGTVSFVDGIYPTNKPSG